MSYSLYDLWLALAPEQALKLGVAFLCGLILGWEREHRDKPAGLRTIILITMGSALYMIVGDLVALTTHGPEGVIRPDPTRIGSQVVSGIGFLGAGTILQSRGSIHGLTTAATIWLAAAVGLCAGVGFYLTAFATTVFVVVVLVALTPLTDKIQKRGKEEEIEFLAQANTLNNLKIRLILEEHNISESEIRAVEWADPENTSASESPDLFIWKVRTKLETMPLIQLLEALQTVEGVAGVPVPTD
jgi:putative Mg2+ transporter-C (MgtC) family protein